AATGNKSDKNKHGMHGISWGGSIVWLHAANNPKLKAGVAWNGRMEGATTTLQTKNAIDVVRQLRAPVLGLYGGADQGIPVESVERMRGALAAAGSRSEIVVYPDAPHGFNADYRPSYRAEAAKDGWKRLQA